MAKLSLVKGTTSYSSYVFVPDSSVTTGAGKTGLAYNTASLKAYYVRPRASATAITLATQTVTGAYSSGGFVEVDSTNLPGIYRLDIPDAALASGVNAVVVMLSGASGMAPVPLEIELTAVDNQDNVRYGMTALPNAAAGANGGLPTGNASGQVTVGTLANNAITAAAIAADAITAAKIADGAIDAATFAAGAINAAAIADGAIDAATFAAGAINAAAIADGAIDAATFAAGAVSEIQSGLMLAASYSAPDNSTISAIASYIDTEVAAIKAKTDNLPASPAATSDIPSAATNAAAVRAELTTELGRLDAAITSRATPAQVNAEVVDALSVDTYAEPGAVPAATSSLKEKIGWLFMLARNKRITTSTADAVRNDADSATVATAALSDDGTFTRGKYS